MSVKLASYGIQFPDNSIQNNVAIGDAYRPIFKMQFQANPPSVPYEPLNQLSTTNIYYTPLNCKFDYVEVDSHNGVDLANRKYVAQISGWYQVHGSVFLYAGGVSDTLNSRFYSATIEFQIKNGSGVLQRYGEDRVQQYSYLPDYSGYSVYGSFTHWHGSVHGLIRLDQGWSIALSASTQWYTSAGGQPAYAGAYLDGYLSVPQG